MAGKLEKNISYDGNRVIIVRQERLDESFVVYAVAGAGPVLGVGP
jgi:hypothetical protein